MEAAAVGTEGRDEGFGHYRDIGGVSVQDDVRTATILLLSLKSHVSKSGAEEDFFSAAGSVETGGEDTVQPTKIKNEVDSMEDVKKEHIVQEESPLSGGQKRPMADSSNHKRKQPRKPNGDVKSKSKHRDYGDHCLSPETLVACKVKDEDSGDSQWILGKVMQYMKDQKKYQVLDVGDNEDPSRSPRYYKLTRSKIRVLPNPPNLNLNPKARTLAVYPNTTVFYPATVRIPAIRRDEHDYLLEFDDEEEQGELRWKHVPADYVIPIAEFL